MNSMEIIESFATSNYVQEAFGKVRLSPEGLDASRVADGRVPYLLSHNHLYPMARVGEVWYEEPRFMHKTEVPEIRATEDFRELREAGVRGTTSVGFRITGLQLDRLGETYEDDHLTATAWELMEISDEPVPADNTGVNRSASVADLLATTDERQAITYRSALGPVEITRAALQGVIAQREEMASLTTKTRQSPAESEPAPEEEVDEDVDQREDEDYEDKEDEKEDERSASRAAKRREARLARAEAAFEKRMAEAETKMNGFVERMGEITVWPKGRMPSIERDGEANLSLGRLVKAQLHRNVGTELAREAEWLERFQESKPTSYDSEAIIPWEFLNRNVRGNTDTITRANETVLADTQGGTPVYVDYANAIGWFRDLSTPLNYFNLMPGMVGEYRVFYGDPTKAPTPQARDEVTNPVDVDQLAVTPITLNPVPIMVAWTMSSSAMVRDDGAMSRFFADAASYITSETLTRVVLSSPNLGANGATVADRPNGVFNSIATKTRYGAAVTAVTRNHIVDAEQRLAEAKASGDNLVWIADRALQFQLRKVLRGGAASTEYVWENNMVDRSVPGVGTSLLQGLHGSSGSGRIAGLGALIYGSRVQVPMWGSGIELITFNDPGSTLWKFGLRIHMNVAVVNPNSGQAISTTPTA